VDSEKLSAVAGVRTNFKLVRDADGGVRLDVLSSHQMVGREGLARPPERVLPDADFEIPLVYSGGLQGLLYASIRVVGSGAWSGLAGQTERLLNLSVGSEERELVETLTHQDAIQVQWAHENLEARYQITDQYKDLLRKALSTAESFTAEEMYYDSLSQGAGREELAAFGVKSNPARTPRTTPRPQDPLPYFASRTGAVPRTGRPTVAGRQMPEGGTDPASEPVYWISDEPLDDDANIASELARAFPDTGIWPLLWTYEEDPTAYMPLPGDFDEVDAIDVEPLLRDRWAALAQKHPEAIRPFAEQFPGLAQAAWNGQQVNDPFACLRTDTARHARLMLVPCHRPADVVAIIGGLASETEGPEISAVLRTWEQRFAAVPIALQPRLATVSVSAPPQSDHQALKLAAEHWAFCPPPEFGEADALRTMATLMSGKHRATHTLGYTLTADRWPVGWYD
jgi:hypothetical protein